MSISLDQAQRVSSQVPESFFESSPGKTISESFDVILAGVLSEIFGSIWDLKDSERVQQRASIYFEMSAD